MPRGTSELKVSASDALDFEAVQANPPKSSRGLNLSIFGIFCAAFFLSGWLFFGDDLEKLFGGNEAIMPRISAPPGPIKIKPEKPGGLQVPNRDKLVYERIESGTKNSRSDLIERLLPRTENPLPKTTLKRAQIPSPRLRSTDPLITKKLDKATTHPMSNVPSVEDVESVKPPPPLSIIPEIGSSATSINKTSDRDPITIKKKVEPDAKRALKQNQVTQSQEVKSKLGKIIQKTPTTSISRRSSSDADLKSKSSNTQISNTAESYKVQLAAARTPERARIEWDRLRRKHLDLLGNFGLTVTRADLGLKKGVFYRLRIGPLADELSARALCDNLSKRKMGCLVIKPGR